MTKDLMCTVVVWFRTDTET